MDAACHAARPEPAAPSEPITPALPAPTDPGPVVHAVPLEPEPAGPAQRAAPKEPGPAEPAGTIEPELAEPGQASAETAAAEPQAAVPVEPESAATEPEPALPGQAIEPELPEAGQVLRPEAAAQQEPAEAMEQRLAAQGQAVEPEPSELIGMMQLDLPEPSEEGLPALPEPCEVIQLETEATEQDLPVASEAVKPGQPPPSKAVKLDLSVPARDARLSEVTKLELLREAIRPDLPASLPEPVPALPAEFASEGEEASPSEPDWTAFVDFAVPDEVQPPLPIPHRKGWRSVTGGKVAAASRLDNRPGGRSAGPLQARISHGVGLQPRALAGMEEGPRRGPLQVRGSCGLALQPRAQAGLEDPASGDNTDVPRSARSSLSEGRSSSSSEGRERPSGAEHAIEEEMLVRWLRSEDFSLPLSPISAGRVQSAYRGEIPRWPQSSPGRVPLALAAGGPEEPEGDRAARWAEMLDESTVGPMPSSPPLRGRGEVPATSPALLPSQFTGSILDDEVFVPTLRRRGLNPSADQHIIWPAGPERPLPGPGRKAEVAEAAAALEAPSVFDYLRSQFADVDVRNRRQISEEELVDFVCSRTQQRARGGRVPEELGDLLRESARRCFRQALVRPRLLRVEDWVHHGLLLTSAPSRLAHELLNRRVRRELVGRPVLLRQLLDVFEAADVRGAGMLRPGDLEEAFEKGGELAREMAAEDEDQISYYAFVAFCLGCRRSSVVLNWYDVSYGYARWLPTKALGGQPLKGIWHTGVVAFGKEYWYGGKVLSSEPGQAPFPPGPLRSTHLGFTLRTREELEDFLRYELVPRYTRESYDVMRHNCNHFSEEVANFLIQGSHIPDEALMQPEAVMSASLLEKLRPYLNSWLSGFEPCGGDAGIDDLMAEWRARLWPGDLALHVPQVDHHEPVQLVQVSAVDVWQGTCDAVCFEPQGACRERGARARAAGRDARALRWGSCAYSSSFWDWRVVRRQGVPIAALRPHTVGGRGHAGTAGAGLSGSLRAHLRTSHPDVQVHLRRKGMVYAHCPQGHFMACGRRRRPWSLSSAPPCGICSRAIAAGEGMLQCPVCGFHLCGLCDHKGLFRGYYSLGSIDAGTAKLLIDEIDWVRYKTRRYMAAAGAAGGMLELDTWLKRVAPRLYGDLGMQLPPIVDLIQLYRQYNHGPDGQPGSFTGLSEDELCDLLFEMLGLAAVGTTALVSL